MITFKRGDLIEVVGLLAVAFGTTEDGGAPEDHFALWLGDPRCPRISKEGIGGQHPEVWTVPSDSCIVAASPVVRHGLFVTGCSSRIESMRHPSPNHALQESRTSRPCCNPRVPWAGLPSLGR